MAAPFPEIMKLSATLSDGKLDYKDWQICPLSHSFPQLSIFQFCEGLFGQYKKWECSQGICKMLQQSPKGERRQLVTRVFEVCSACVGEQSWSFSKGVHKSVGIGSKSASAHSGRTHRLIHKWEAIWRRNFAQWLTLQCWRWRWKYLPKRLWTFVLQKIRSHRHENMKFRLLKMFREAFARLFICHNRRQSASEWTWARFCMLQDHCSRHTSWVHYFSFWL
jgi:hypothetical protein